MGAEHDTIAAAQIEDGVQPHAEKTDATLHADAVEAETAEYNMTVLEAVRAYPMACLWAFLMSCTIIMESYDVFL